MASAAAFRFQDLVGDPTSPVVYALSDSVSRPVAVLVRTASTADPDPRSPRWMEPTLAAVERLLALDPGWDGYGAPSIDRTALGDALQLLYGSARAETPPPAIVPTGTGGVQLEWHDQGFDIEVYLQPREPGAGLFIHDHREGVQIETKVFTDVTLLSEALDRLTRRSEQEPEAR